MPTWFHLQPQTSHGLGCPSSLSFGSHHVYHMTGPPTLQTVARRVSSVLLSLWPPPDPDPDPYCLRLALGLSQTFQAGLPLWAISLPSPSCLGPKAHLPVQALCHFPRAWSGIREPSLSWGVGVADSFVLRLLCSRLQCVRSSPSTCCHK